MYRSDEQVNNISDSTHNIFSGTKFDMRENVATDELMILVSNILLQLGIPVKIKGYAYLREAIIIKISKPQSEMPVTKILYPSVAKKFDTSAVRVERAIRHAIGAAWSRTDESYRNKIFSYPFPLEMRPTNSEFIAMIADRIILLRN